MRIRKTVSTALLHSSALFCCTRINLEISNFFGSKMRKKSNKGSKESLTLVIIMMRTLYFFVAMIVYEAALSTHSSAALVVPAGEIVVEAVNPDEVRTSDVEGHQFIPQFSRAIPHTVMVKLYEHCVSNTGLMMPNRCPDKYAEQTYNKCVGDQVLLRTANGKELCMTTPPDL